VLIPQPSDDINDPLNWPSWKKTLAFSTIIFFMFISTWMTAGIATAIVVLSKEFNVDLNTAVTGLVSWVVFTLGVGVFSSPIALIRMLFGLPRLFGLVGDLSF
jgi:hypothetical protein